MSDQFAQSSTPISNESSVTSVLSIKSLFGIIFERLHQLYAVDCAVLKLYDKQRSQIVDSYISCLSAEKEIRTTVIPGKLSLAVIPEVIAHLDFPILKTSEEWIAQFQENHSLINGDSNYQFHCYIPLEADNKVVGTLELHNYKHELSKECLDYCSIMNDFLGDCISRSQPQLNVAMLNAVANEKITQQLEEINRYKQQLEEEKLYLQEENQISNRYSEIIGQGPKMQDVFNLLSQVADTETTVLILGETGTGKELIARAIHNGSSRAQKSMVKVNCAAIPANLIESELFGHEKGSFTGATERRLGKFELANHSTLFLDEIGELSLELQVKLLRALQEKEIERVGGRAVIHTDVRIISATNRNLAQEVEAGRFRRDLFYRLNVFPISLPALRNRKEDLPLLALHFLSQFGYKTGKSFSGFSKKALQEMHNYDWPGNIRELEHLIERQVLLNAGPIIKSIEVPGLAQRMIQDDNLANAVKTIFENERDHIFNVLKLCNGKVSGADGAAKLLGVPATTLNSKIKRLSLSKKHIF